MKEDFRKSSRTHGQLCGGPCSVRLDHVGAVYERTVGMKITLYQCRKCDVLVALYLDREFWTVSIPSATPTPARDTALTCNQ